jgi:hypothetical protein
MFVCLLTLLAFASSKASQLFVCFLFVCLFVCELVFSIRSMLLKPVRLVQMHGSARVSPYARIQFVLVVWCLTK